MRVLGLFCSPRREGNTDLLLNELFRGVRDEGAETEKVDACHLRIAPCRGCGTCGRTGRCVIADEMQEVYDRIDAADTIVLASPIYFYNVTAQCKMLIDRCQALWSRKYILRRTSRLKRGFFLSVGATKGKKMFDCAILTVRYFFDAINATYAGHLSFREIDAKGEISNHPTALREAYEAGTRLVNGIHRKENRLKDQGMEAVMGLEGKKVIILAENNYQELELWYPLLRLKEAGAEVKVVGSGSSSTYTSKMGYPVTADFSADAVNMADYDGIIIPGGYAPDIMRRYPSMVKLVREAHDRGKVIGAICHAGWMLVSAGILKGKRATCFFAIRDDLINAGAEYLDQEVVRDGNLVTSRMPDDLPAFCQGIIQALGG